jgi:hypothetical protein
VGQDKRRKEIVEGTIGTGLKNSMRGDTCCLGFSIAGSRRERRKKIRGIETDIGFQVNRDRFSLIFLVDTDGFEAFQVVYMRGRMMSK